MPATKPKSLSAKKKEVESHFSTINNTFHNDGISVAVLDAYKPGLKSAKNQAGLESWYRGYTKRVGELLEHHSHHARFVNDQRQSIERIIGIQEVNNRMTKWRKKPIAVDAYQMTASRKAMAGVTDLRGVWPNWLIAAWVKQEKEPGKIDIAEDGTRRMTIYTLEGPHVVNDDAWIIRGVEDEIWAVKDSIFRKTYEPIPDDNDTDKEG